MRSERAREAKLSGASERTCGPGGLERRVRGRDTPQRTHLHAQPLSVPSPLSLLSPVQPPQKVARCARPLAPHYRSSSPPSTSTTTTTATHPSAPGMHAPSHPSSASSGTRMPWTRACARGAGTAAAAAAAAEEEEEEAGGGGGGAGGKRSGRRVERAWCSVVGEPVSACVRANRGRYKSQRDGSPNARRSDARDSSQKRELTVLLQRRHHVLHDGRPLGEVHPQGDTPRPVCVRQAAVRPGRPERGGRRRRARGRRGGKRRERDEL